MKDNISKLHHCYGCGVCVPACPKKIIRLDENSNGFYSPVVFDEANCIECGICLDVCGFNHSEPALETTEITAFAGWSNDKIVRHRCSSGGVGYEIGKVCLEKGYKCIGVRYDAEKKRAMHFISSTLEEFMQTVGSKYMPSNTLPAFNEITRKEKYLVTGAPCQIDTFRRYIRRFKIEDNFILLDFFCHGVPSLLLWDKYLAEVEERIGKSTFASWRNKEYGWHDSYSINIDTDNESRDYRHSYDLTTPERKHSYSSRLLSGDLFFKYFLGNYCLNDCCYNCKYKLTKSSADIRIGDLWGKTFASDTQGVTTVLALTDKGRDLLGEISHRACTLTDYPVATATEGQMSGSPRCPFVRTPILKALQGNDSLKSIADKWCRLYQIANLPRRIVNKIKRTLFSKK